MNIMEKIFEIRSWQSWRAV